MSHTRNVILLVGGELCRRVASGLAAQEWEIFGLRRHPPAVDGVRWLRADLTRPRTLGDLPATVTHIMFAPAPDARSRERYEATYPDGLRNLLDALPRPQDLRRVVMVGSTVVWPPSAATDADAWVDETKPACAHDFRSAALLAAERILLDRCPHAGVVLRLGGLYGPGRTRLLDALRDGSLVAPAGPGHWSNRMHVDDAASACRHLLALHDAAPCYIGTDGHPTRTAMFYDRLADLLRLPHPVRRARPPSGKRLSNARLAASGWAPRWPDALAGYRALLAA